MNLDAVDPTFIEDLRSSKEAVNRAAKWLSSKGYPVIVRPTFERPDSSVMSDYSDSGDLEIVQRVEVKRRELEFTSKDDYPFDTVIVDVCHAYDKAVQKPYAYIIFNRVMTTALVVNVKETRQSWVAVERQSRGRTRNFYECPLRIDGVSVVKMEG